MVRRHLRKSPCCQAPTEHRGKPFIPPLPASKLSALGPHSRLELGKRGRGKHGVGPGAGALLVYVKLPLLSSYGNCSPAPCLPQTTLQRQKYSRPVHPHSLTHHFLHRPTLDMETPPSRCGHSLWYPREGRVLSRPWAMQCVNTSANGDNILLPRPHPFHSFVI